MNSRYWGGVDLRVESGEVIAITGSSGAGKSTLLHLLGALDRPTSGGVSLGGRDLSEVDGDELARMRNVSVGFVFPVPSPPERVYGVGERDDALFDRRMAAKGFGGEGPRTPDARRARRTYVPIAPHKLSGGNSSGSRSREL